MIRARRTRGGLARSCRAWSAVFGAGWLAVLAGCETNSFLGDPRATGSWKNTPTVVPILERIDVIETDTGSFVEVTEVTAEDLVPIIEDYRVSAGDFLQVSIFDIDIPGQPTINQLNVDSTGAINLPQLGRVQVQGLTTEEVQQAIAARIVEMDILQAPDVSVQLLGKRLESFSIFGTVPAPARYQIPYPDYRLLEALTDAGGISPIIKYVYVIRQVPLSDEVKHGIRNIPAVDGSRPSNSAGGGNVPVSPDDGDELLRLIDELTEPQEGDPGVVSFGAARGAWQDGASPGPGAAIDLVDDAPEVDRAEPVIDLVDDAGVEAEHARGPIGEPAVGLDGVSRWLFVNGEWVQVLIRRDAESTGISEGADPLAESQAAELVTQRVIKVPTGPLLQGVASYNIVIRPQDVISVPGPEQGAVYIGGPGITGPGVYSLPVTGRMTIQKAIITAGGLSPIAAPTRVDLTRMIGGDKQATVRLNVKDILAQQQPDVFLRPDDVLTFGTSFWATPLAIVRGGFRTSYGFGFLLDRNFGNDVFGAPPSNNNND